jgi:hypothetical protein
MVASSGVASLCLKGGRTAHSTFRIPIEIHETSTCSVPLQSELATMLRDCRVIIFDETTMSNKHQLMAVCHLLRVRN